MSRFRSREVPYSSRATATNSYNGTQTALPTVSSEGTSYCNVLSRGEITDDISTGWNGFRPIRRLKDGDGVSHSIRPLHYCLHKKVHASIVSRDSWRDFENYGSHYPTPFTNNVAFVPKTLSYPSAPSINWVSLTVGLANQVKGLIQSQSLIGVTVQEYTKTVRMLKNPFSLLKGSPRGREILKTKATAKVLASSASNAWLEANYGWRSLYYDIKGYAKAFTSLRDSLHNHTSLGGLREFHNRSVSTGTPVNPSISDATWNGYLVNDYKYIVASTPYPYSRIVWRVPKTTACLSCCAVERFHNFSDHCIQAAHAFGLSVDQVTHTLWEVLPFSFVVDWFVNTKALLDLPRYTTAVKELTSTGVSGLCYSTKVEQAFVAQIRTLWPTSFTKPYGYNYSGGSQGDGRPIPSITGSEGIVSRFERTAGLPSGYGSIFSNRGLSFAQVTSAVALFFQRLHL